MPHIVPLGSDLPSYTGNAVPLASYAHALGIPECSFWGVSIPNPPAHACRDIWLKSERDMIWFALNEAQEEIEKVTSFPLYPRWIGGSQNIADMDVKNYRPIVTAYWSYVIEAGRRAEEDIELSVPLSHLSDPATLSLVALPATVTNIEEVHIYHEGTDIEISPSAIDLDTLLGTMTISVPRCRLVLPALADNPPEGLDYNDLTNFASKMDVRRIYNDPSIQAIYKWPRGITCGDTCTPYTLNHCLTILSPKLGELHLPPPNTSYPYSGPGCLSAYGNPETVSLNYRAGMIGNSRQITDTTIRLAHSKMPAEPCGCDLISNYWKRDRNTPDALSVERLNCPFGLSDGAWTAWAFAKSMAVVRAGSFL